MRDDAHLFLVAEERRDGVLVVRPTQEVRGIGGRIAAGGLLPAEASADAIHMLFEVERCDDPVWECRYLHVRCRAGHRFAPLDAKLALGWPLRNTDLLVAVLRRGLRDMLAAARETRRNLARLSGSGLGVEPRRKP
jgi:hypothetical protein